MWVTPMRLVETYAKSLTVYEEAETAFKADPTVATMHAFELAADRFWALRAKARRLICFSDAVIGTEDAALTPPPAAPPDPS